MDINNAINNCCVEYVQFLDSHPDCMLRDAQDMGFGIIKGFYSSFCDHDEINSYLDKLSGELMKICNSYFENK